MGRLWPGLAGPGGLEGERWPASRLFITQEATGRISEDGEWYDETQRPFIRPQIYGTWSEPVADVCGSRFGTTLFTATEVEGGEI